MKKIFCILSILSITMFFLKNTKQKSQTDTNQNNRRIYLFHTFPAYFPDGNKAFLKKIDQQGNVLNISTFGKNENFNKEVKVAAAKIYPKYKMDRWKK